jgi:uncharacterized protein (TIGR02118 family)
MFKLVALWSAPKPEDVDDFEAAYHASHAPKARALPNLTALETIRISQGLEGSPPVWHRVAVMIWPDHAAFERDTGTPEWRALREDGGGMVERFGVTLTASMGEDG